MDIPQVLKQKGKGDDRPARSAGGGRPPGFFRVLGWAALILSLPALGYGYYVYQQMQDVRERSVRTLAHTAGAIEDLVANAKTTLEKLPNRPEFACDFQYRQIHLRLEDPKSCNNVRKILEASPRDSFVVLPQRTPLGLEFSLEHQPATTGQDAVSASGEASGETETERQPIRWAVRFDQLLQDIPFGRNLDVLVVADGTGRVVEQYPEPTLRAEEQISRQEQLAERTISGSVLSRLRIADLNGLRITRPISEEAEARYVQMSTLQAGTAILPVSLAGEDGTLVCQPFVVESLLNSGQHGSPAASSPRKASASSEAGDDDAVSANKDGDSRWVLCGLIQRDRMFQEALQVAPYLSVFLLAVLFFGLFLMPIAKLVTMAPRERLRFSDVYLLLLGTWGSLMMAGVFVLSFDTFHQLAERSEQSLEHLAEVIEARMADEIRDVIKQVRAYDDQVTEAITKQLDALDGADEGQPRDDGAVSPQPAVIAAGGGTGAPAAAGQPSVFWDSLREGENRKELLPAESWDIVRLLLQPGSDGNASVTDQDDPGSESAPALLRYPKHYPDLAQIFWMQPCDGLQILKASKRDHNTPRVSVRKRDYFGNVQTDRLWERADDEGNRFFVQSFRSMTTGEFLAALSMPSRLSEPEQGKDEAGGEDDDKPHCSPIQRLWRLGAGKLAKDATSCDDNVYGSIRERTPGCGLEPKAAVALSTRFVAVTEPLLAPGVGFAIVDAGGNALFHSEEASALFENLVDEMREGDRLRAAIASRTPRHMRTHYRTQPVRVYVRPMGDLPWTLVTFEDQEVIRASHLEALMHGAFLVLLHMLAYFALTLAYMAVRGRRAPKWMWPHLSTRRSDHRWMIWMLVVLIVSAGVAVQFSAGDTLFWFGLLFPLLPLGVLALSPFLIRGDKHPRFIVPCACVAVALVGFLWGIATIPWDHVTESKVPLSLMALAWIGVAYPLRRDTVTNATDESAARLRLYIWAAVLVWALISLVPAWSYTKLAIQNQGAVLVKTENLHLMDRLTARESRIREQYRDVSMRDGNDVVADRLYAGDDVYWSSLFWPAEEKESSPSKREAESKEEGDKKSSTIEDCWCSGEGVVAERIISCPRSKDGRQEEGSSHPAGCQRALKGCAGGSVCDLDTTDFERLESPWLWSWVTDFLPIYSQASERMRFLEQHSAGYGEWSRLFSGKVLFDGRFGPEVNGRQLLLSVPPVTGVEFHWISIVGLAVIGLLLFRWVAYAARSLFFGAIPYGSPDSREQHVTFGSDGGSPIRKVLQVTSPRDEEAFTTAEDAHVVDLSDKVATWRTELEAAADAEMLVLTGVEVLAEDSVNAGIDALQLASQLRAAVLLVVVYDDLFALLEKELDKEDPGGEGSSASSSGVARRRQRLREAAVRGRFDSLTVPVGKGDELLRSLYRQQPKKTGDGTGSEAENGPGRAPAVPTAHSVHGLNRLYWQVCTLDERLVLLQLAQEKFVNPKQQKAVRQLLARGLLDRNPVLRIKNSELESYVAGLDVADNVATMERDYEGLGWRQVQRILAALILLLAAFLWTTQPTAVEAMVGLLSAVGVGAGALLKVFGAAGQLSASGSDSR